MFHNHMGDDFNNLGASGWQCGLTFHAQHI